VKLLQSLRQDYDFTNGAAKNKSIANPCILKAPSPLGEGVGGEVNAAINASQSFEFQNYFPFGEEVGGEVNIIKFIQILFKLI
jgi:hypothetical protein